MIFAVVRSPQSGTRLINILIQSKAYKSYTRVAYRECIAFGCRGDFKRHICSMGGFNRHSYRKTVSLEKLASTEFYSPGVVLWY